MSKVKTNNQAEMIFTATLVGALTYGLFLMSQVELMLTIIK